MSRTSTPLEAVKPVALIRYLQRLITPPGGTTLDPYLGSGTSGIAAAREGFAFIGIELDPDYYQIAHQRVLGRPDPLGGFVL